jgi:ABC-type antimicrobial peptide transport system permease subunit
MQISFPINEKISALLNFTVMGTVDNHLAYVYANGSERAGYKFSSKTLNYNSNQNFSLKMDNPFTEGLDVDGNVFFTTYSELAYQLGQYLENDITTEDIYRLTNHVYIKIALNANVTDVVNGLIQHFSDAGLNNLSVCAYKQYFLDSLTEVGSLTIKMEPGYNDTRLLSDLKEWYTFHNYTWRAGAIGQSSMLFRDLNYFPMIFSVVNLITIFSLIISFIGLCMVTYDATQKQAREFGIIKSIGFKNKDIRRIVLVQMFIITFSGIPLGLLSSIVMMNIVLGSMNSSLLLPYVFSVPWGTLISIGSLMTVFSILAAYWTAISITKQPILHAFRFRN